MAKIKLIVDTDIIIDYLKGVKPARELFKSKDIVIYCSILSEAPRPKGRGISFNLQTLSSPSMGED